MTSGCNLKPGWQRVKFGDVVRLSKERSSDPIVDGYDRFIGLEHIEPEDLRIRRWGNVADGVTFTSVFKPGQVLFGKRRAYQRKVAVADFAGVCSGDIYVLESKDPKRLLPELLPFICQTEAFFQHAVGTSAGSLSPRTNWTSLADFEFALPPLEEQQRITQLLNQLCEVSESLLIALTETKRLKKAFAAHVFSHGLNAESLVPAGSHYRQMPTNWNVRPLGEVFDILDNKRKPLKDSDRNKRQGQYPYYGASGQIDSIDDYIFDESILLLSEDGMNLLFRSSPIVYLVTEKCWVNNHAHVLRPTQIAVIDFYFEYLESISFEPFVTGTYQKKITKSDCERIPLPVPPISEQLEIVTIFSEINNRMAEISARQIETQDFFKISRESLMRTSDV